jgi:predicted AAA+ superfamily ATPase
MQATPERLWLVGRGLVYYAHNMNVYRSHGGIISPLPRAAGLALEAALGVFPVAVVIGARQTGKSTLVQSLPGLAGHAYRTLDDLELRDQARRDPASVLAFGDKLILDEVQRAPELLSAVKQAVDRDRPRRTGRFVLTGSANLLLMDRVSESLAGRAAYLRLWPLTRREQLGLGRAGIWGELLEAPTNEWEAIIRAQAVPRGDWEMAARVGGLPVPAHELETPEERARWFDGYVETYLERDLQALSRIEDLGDFRRLMRAAALRLGQVAHQADLARDVGLSRPTAHRWLNLLETSFQIIRVGAYAVNRTKRLVKSPRLYWSDAGLALHLAGGDPTGAHLENLVLTDLVVWRELVTPRPEILYWRTVNGEEVDFVIEAGQRLLPVEVKATERPGYRDARHLLTFRQEYGEAVYGGLVLHTGAETFWLAEEILAAPWWLVV